MKPFFELLPEDEIGERRQRIRRVWEYQEVDHIPVHLTVSSNSRGYTVTEQMLDRKKLLEVNLEGVKNTLLCNPDYLPSMRPDVGCIVIASTFGAEVVYGSTPEQTPYVKSPIIKDIDQIYALRVPDPFRDGLMPEGLERVRLFAEATDHRVAVSIPDLGGPVNAALDLLGGDLLFSSMYEAPEALEYLLDLLTETFILFADVSIEAAGGMEHITCTDFPDIWCPEGKKGHASDDICASYSPAFFERFSMPYNNRIFARYGGGMFHNCGPNPSIDKYLKHNPRIGAVDLAYRCSKVDLERIKQAFNHQGIVYFYLEDGTAEEKLADWRHIMEILTPDVIAIPWLQITPEEDGSAIYQKFLEVSKEYAARMDWR